MDPLETVKLIKYTAGSLSPAEDEVVKEIPVTLFLNDEELVTLVCSPTHLKELAVGFLCSEGILKQREDLSGIAINHQEGLIWAETKNPPPAQNTFMKRFITTCCGRGRASFYFINDARDSSPVTSNLRVAPRSILTLAAGLEAGASLFKTTGGAHGAALCSGEEILMLFEDIGRHNAVDKIFGHCFLNNIELSDKIMVFSGRVSTEILIKVARMGIPILVSRSAPTHLALNMAEELGVTVVGFTRGERMNVYTHHQRIQLEQE